MERSGLKSVVKREAPRLLRSSRGAFVAGNDWRAASAGQSPGAGSLPLQRRGGRPRIQFQRSSANSVCMYHW